MDKKLFSDWLDGEISDLYSDISLAISCKSRKCDIENLKGQMKAMKYIKSMIDDGFNWRTSSKKR
jgi:hypothetical protein